MKETFEKANLQAEIEVYTGAARGGRAFGFARTPANRIGFRRIMLVVPPRKWAAHCVVVMFAGIAAGWLLQACGASSATAPSTPTSTPSASTVVSVAVSGSAPPVGATTQYSATATLSDGTTQSVTSAASWSSSNNSVASVSASGVVTGVAAGDADITATYQTIGGKARVTIVRPAPGTFTISGALRDGTSGGALPKIPIQATDSTGTIRSATTDTSGAYAISGVPPGSVALAVSIASYEPFAQTAMVLADTRVDLVLTRLRPTLDLSGTWTGSGSDGLGPETFSWVLTQSGTALSGSVSMRPLSTSDGSCSSCHKVKDGTISGSVSGTAVTLRMSFALGGSQPTPACLVIMDVSAPGATSTSLSSSYNGSDSCEPLVALGSITMTRQ